MQRHGVHFDASTDKGNKYVGSNHHHSCQSNLSLPSISMPSKEHDQHLTCQLDSTTRQYMGSSALPPNHQVLTLSDSQAALCTSHSLTAGLADVGLIGIAVKLKGEGVVIKGIRKEMLQFLQHCNCFGAGIYYSWSLDGKAMCTRLDNIQGENGARPGLG